MLHVTDATRQAYLAGGGTYCLFCDAHDIEGDFVEVDVGGASQRVDCHDCGRHWFDLYTLTGVLTDSEVDEQAARLIAVVKSGATAAADSPSPDTPSVDASAALANVLVVVEGGLVRAVFAADGTRVQVIDFDNLKDGDIFDSTEWFPVDGEIGCSAARDVMDRAGELSRSNRQLEDAE